MVNSFQLEGLGHVSQELPPYESTLADTFLAVIGALAEDGGITRAQHFVLDFLVINLLDVDVNELFLVNDPMATVADILEREGRTEPETRLLRRCGDTSPEAVYLIGVYSDKELIGQCKSRQFVFPGILFFQHEQKWVTTYRQKRIQSDSKENQPDQ